MKNLSLAMIVLLSVSMRIAAQDIPLSKILVEKEGWREIAAGSPLHGKSKAELSQATIRSNAGHVFEINAIKLKGLKAPTCLTLWPDEGHLVIGESDGAYLWAVRIEKDGSLGPGDRYYSLRTKPNEKMHVTAMVMDAGYLLYACTPLGIQVFDPTGRLSGVVAAPSKEPMTAITIGGVKADELFVAAGDKIYARRIQGKAAYTLKK
jgi:sugar lactone lactonase YvrE